MPIKKDYWWELDEGTNIGSLSDELISIIKTKILPALVANSNEYVLEKEWLNVNAYGLTTFEKFKYLTILLKVHNSSQLSEVTEQLRHESKGKAYEYQAEEHIKRLKF